jgi:leader peptidase (prepilin peptidase)/N-methyltransferase
VDRALWATFGAAIVGLVLGAALPRIAYRLSVPFGEPNLAACGVCGAAFPSGLTGWIRIGGRCDSCRGRVGPSPVVTTLASGAAAAALTWLVFPDPAWPLYPMVAVLGVLLAMIDLACKRLPHDLVVPATAVTAVALIAIAAGSGQWADLLRAALGATVLSGLFFLLYLVPGQGLGFGDVKVAVLLGLLLGWLGWPEVLLGALLPWLVNGPVVLVLLLIGRVGRKSTLPFGPALLGGFLLAIGVSGWLPVVGRS